LERNDIKELHFWQKHFAEYPQMRPKEVPKNLGIEKDSSKLLKRLFFFIFVF